MRRSEVTDRGCTGINRAAIAGIAAFDAGHESSGVGGLVSRRSIILTGRGACVPAAKSRRPAVPSPRGDGTRASSAPRSGPSPVPPSSAGGPVPHATFASTGAPPSTATSSAAGSTARTVPGRRPAPRPVATTDRRARTTPASTRDPAIPAPKRTAPTDVPSSPLATTPASASDPSPPRAPIRAVARSGRKTDGSAPPRVGRRGAGEPDPATSETPSRRPGCR